MPEPDPLPFPDVAADAPVSAPCCSEGAGAINERAMSAEVAGAAGPLVRGIMRMVMELLRSLEFPPPPGPLGAEDDGCPGRTWGGQCDERVGSELAECSEPSVSQEYGMRWSRWCESSGWAKDVFVGLVGCGMTRLSGPSRWICTWLILRRDESTLTGADAVIGCGPTVETNVCPLPPLAAAADVPAAPTTLLSALSATVCAVPPPDSAENTGFAGHAHVTLVVEPIVNAGPTHVNLF